MIDLKAINDDHADDIAAVHDWCEEIYSNQFAPYFQGQRELFARLKSKTHPITDEELESILTELPLHLFSVSEVLNKFKISKAVVKLKTKQKERHCFELSTEKTITAKQAEASQSILEDVLLQDAYTAVIDRVEHEIGFCRELIMGAKKIWDGRRNTEGANPLRSMPTNAPDIDLSQDHHKLRGKSYVG